MKKTSKSIYIIGCAIIAIIVILVMYFVLIAADVISVRQRSLIVQAGSAEKVYDGTPLTCLEWSLVEGSLHRGHHVSAVFDGSQTEPGESSNVVTLRVLDSNNIDVTKEYSIQYLAGTLTVRTYSLTLQSASYEKLYDGTPLVAESDSWRITEGDLQQGHRLSVKISASQTVAGTAQNLMQATVFDANGKDVSYLYTMNYLPGNVTVKPVPLWLESASAAKVYDGTALTDHRWTYRSGYVASGETIEFVWEGTQTEIGQSQNIFKISIKNSAGASTIDNYSLNLIPGTLTVVATADQLRPPTQNTPGTIPGGGSGGGGSGGSGSGGSGGSESGGGGSGGSGGSGGGSGGGLADDGSIDKEPPQNNGEGEIQLKYFTQYDGMMYLRYKSFGNYNGTDFDPVSNLFLSLQAEINPLLLTGELLAYANYKNYEISFSLNAPQYLIPYYLRTAPTSLNDTVIDDTSTEYKVNFIPASIEELLSLQGALPESLLGFEEEYREHVYANYLQLPDSTKQALLQLARENGLRAGDPNLIGKVASYIQNAAVYHLDFAEIPEGEDTVLYFLTVSKEGICQHFAASGVAMFRALGIPARYCIGYASQSNPGEWTTVDGSRAHAWVEIYLDGIGWVPVEVTGSSDGLLVVKPQDEMEMFSGTPLVAKNYEILDGSLKPGHWIDCTYAGEQTAPGGSESSFASFIIRDADGVDVSDQYRISLRVGALEIRPRTITIKVDDAMKEFDGTPLTSTTYQVTNTQNASSKVTIADTHRLELTFSGSQTSYGRSDNEITEYRLVDRVTGEDVTHGYVVTTVKGTLHVYRSILTIRTESAEKVYDGTPLTQSEWSFISGTLAAEHELSVTMECSATTVKDSKKNTPTVKVIDKITGEDVTDQYFLRGDYGTLTITAQHLVLQTNSAQKSYDGTPLVCHEYTVLEGTLAAGEFADIEFLGTQTSVGYSENTLKTITIRKEDGTDTTANYSIESSTGILTVTPPTNG